MKLAIFPIPFLFLFACQTPRTVMVCKAFPMDDTFGMICVQVEEEEFQRSQPQPVPAYAPPPPPPDRREL